MIVLVILGFLVGAGIGFFIAACLKVGKDD